MIRIQLVSVPVSDQEAALSWYKDKVGCTVKRDQDMGGGARWIQVTMPGGGADLVLFTPPGHEDRVGTFSPICFTADDVHKEYERLTENGVEFQEKPTEQPWGGVQAIFNDPDGNAFVLHSAS